MENTATVESQRGRKAVQRGSGTGRWANYRRRYCKSWEREPVLKAWIRPIPHDCRRAYCLFCKVELRAHYTDLLKHVKTAKHQRNKALHSDIIHVIEPTFVDADMPVQPDTCTDPLTGVVPEQALESYVETQLVEGSHIKVGILTVSDRCFKGETQDTSGPNLVEKVKEFLSGNVIARQCVPDSIPEIQKVLMTWCDEQQFDVIFTTGGTGFSPRDVTPEATSALLERHAPGISVAMTVGSLKHTSMAMLSRSVCGIRGKTLIINLPGSSKGSQECLEIISPVIGHAVAQLSSNRNLVDQVHQQIGSEHHKTSELVPEEHRGECHTKAGHSHVSQVAYRARSSPFPIISVEYAQSIIMNKVVLEGTEMCSYRECMGCYLVNDVVSQIALPPFRASIKDGYAVIAADGAGNRKVLGEAAAGSSPEVIVVKTGGCARISTGAPVPEGADAVVQVEDTELIKERFDGTEEVEVKIVKAPRVGQDIREIGSDIALGQTVLERHQKLGPSELGLLATIGMTNICVFKKPVVSVLSTGSEILEPGQPLRGGCIWDSNKTCILSMLQEHGYRTEECGIAKDTYDTVVSKLSQAFENGSVVITTGGVSMGEKDLVKLVLVKHFGAKIHFGQVFMKPGKPTTFATCKYQSKKKFIFALPGNPVSAVVTFNLFVLPALRSMSGDLNKTINTIRVKVEHGISLDPRPEYHRAVVTWNPKDPVPTAHTTGNQISSRLLSMKSANAILILPPYSMEKQTIAEEEIVDAIMIARI